MLPHFTPTCTAGDAQLLVAMLEGMHLAIGLLAPVDNNSSMDNLFCMCVEATARLKTRNCSVAERKQGASRKLMHHVIQLALPTCQVLADKGWSESSDLGLCHGPQLLVGT
jgi:hypothetical protein